MDGTVLIMDYSSYERQKIRHIVEKAGNFNMIEVGRINQFNLIGLDIDDLKLVVLDLAFPTEKDGFEALEKIRSSENGKVPVIIATRADKPEYKEDALKYSVNDYILKPYPIKRLENSVKSIVHVVRDFHYDTSQIDGIRMSFDDFVKRETKLSKRTQNPFSIILVTTLRINTTDADKRQGAEGNGQNAVISSGQNVAKANGQNAAEGGEDEQPIFGIAAQKAGESVRTTDAVFTNKNRDIIILLPCTDEAGVKTVCEKIRMKIEQELEKAGAEKSRRIYPVSVTFPEDGDNFQMLMEKAFKKISDKEMLEKIVSVPQDKRDYAEKSYSRYRKWF